MVLRNHWREHAPLTGRSPSDAGDRANARSTARGRRNRKVSSIPSSDGSNSPMSVLMLEEGGRMKRFEQLIHAIRIGVIAMATVTSPALSSTPTAAENNDTAIRPFRVTIPEQQLAELRRR